MDQKVDRQLLAYNKADSIYIDKMSGIKSAEGIAIVKSQGKYKGRKNSSISLHDSEASRRFRIFYNSDLAKSAIARELKSEPFSI